MLQYTLIESGRLELWMKTTLNWWKTLPFNCR